MAISFVQAAATPGAFSASLAYGSDNTSGNLLVCVYRRVNATGGPTSITDTQTNFWAARDFAIGSTLYGIGFAPNCKAGANTVALNTADFYEFVIAEYSGVSQFDQSTSMLNNASSFSVGPITPSSAKNLVIAMVENETANSLTLSSIGGGFTNRANSLGNVFLLDLIQSTATPSTASATFSQSVSWGAAIADFIPQAVTSSVPNSLMLLGVGT